MSSQFAQLNDDGVVINIVIIPDSEIDRGQEYLSLDLGLEGEWIHTNTNSKNNFASIGGIYSYEHKLFSPSKPYPSWSFDWDNFVWLSPIKQPEGMYDWHEDVLSWFPAPSPFPSWIWIEGYWNPPISYPEDGKLYDWDEKTKSWVEIYN